MRMRPLGESLRQLLSGRGTFPNSPGAWQTLPCPSGETRPGSQKSDPVRRQNADQRGNPRTELPELHLDLGGSAFGLVRVRFGKSFSPHLLSGNKKQTWNAGVSAEEVSE